MINISGNVRMGTALSASVTSNSALLSSVNTGASVSANINYNQNGGGGNQGNDIYTSPDGTLWKLSVEDDGALVTEVYGGSIIPTRKYIIYSTTETIIGTWMDSRNVYQKTYKVEFSSYASFTEQVSAIFADTNIDNWISVSGFSNAKTIKDSIPYTFSGTYSLYELCFTMDETSATTTELSPIYLTVQYTKISE